MKFLLILLLLLSCAKTISTDSDVPLIDRLQKTEWQISIPNRNNSVKITKETIQLKSSGVLGVAPSTYEIQGFTNDFVLLTILNDIDPQYLGIELLDQKTIRLAIWPATTQVPTREAQDLVKGQGAIYNLKQ